MSERIRGTAVRAVGRACGFTALCVGSVMNALEGTPILAFKAGGLLALIVSFALMLLASRAERTCFSKTRIWRELEGRERPSSERAQAVIGGARARAHRVYAYRYAIAAAACLTIAVAGEINLIVHPPR